MRIFFNIPFPQYSSVIFIHYYVLKFVQNFYPSFKLSKKNFCDKMCRTSKLTQTCISNPLFVIFQKIKPKYSIRKMENNLCKWPLTQTLDSVSQRIIWRKKHFHHYHFSLRTQVHQSFERIFGKQVLEIKASVINVCISTYKLYRLQF